MRCPALRGAFVVWYHLCMTNNGDNDMTTAEWAEVHTDGDHASVIADGDTEDEFGYRVADCPLCSGDTTTEAIIRDLVALGDTINTSALDLVMGLDGVNGNPDAVAIIERHLGRPMTDSDVDDLTDFIDGGDLFND